MNEADDIPPYRWVISSLRQAKMIPLLSETATRVPGAEKANCTLGCTSRSMASRAGEMALPLYPNTFNPTEQIQWKWDLGTACLGCCVQRVTEPLYLSSLSSDMKVLWLLLHSHTKKLFLWHWDVLSSFPNIFTRNGSLWFQLFRASHQAASASREPAASSWISYKALPTVSASTVKFGWNYSDGSKRATEDRQLPIPLYKSILFLQTVFKWPTILGRCLGLPYLWPLRNCTARSSRSESCLSQHWDYCLKAADAWASFLPWQSIQARSPKDMLAFSFHISVSLPSACARSQLLLCFSFNPELPIYLKHQKEAEGRLGPALHLSHWLIYSWDLEGKVMQMEKKKHICGLVRKLLFCKWLQHQEARANLTWSNNQKQCYLGH